MSVLKFKVQQFEDAKKKLGDTKSKLDDTIEKTAEANKYFILTQMGTWIEAQGDACVQIETDARIFREAMVRFETTFGKLAGDAKTIEGDRDGFVSELGAGGKTDLVVCDTGSNVGGKCIECVGHYDNLNAKADNALSSLAGLRDAGAIQSAIESVKGDVSTQKAKVDSVRGKWDTLKQHASEFESKYSANKDDSQSLRARNFITADMVKSAGTALEKSYSEGPIAQFFAGAKDAKESWLKPLKNTLNAVGKPLDDIDVRSTTAFFGGVAQLIKGRGGFRSYLENLFVGSHSVGVGTAIAGRLSGFNKSLFQFKGTTWKKFTEKLIKDETLGSLNKALTDLKGGWKGATRAADGAMEFAEDAGKFSKISKVKGFGKLIKGAGKTVGVVGDVIEVGSIFNNTAAAYHDTAGDAYDKSASATVEAVKGVAKFGAGKAVGAIVGTCLGGPIGTAIGVGIGIGIDSGMTWLADKFKESGAQKKVSKAVGNAFRSVGNFFDGIFGKKKKNAFAPA